MTEIGEETLKQYRGYLADREKSIATIDKYLRDIRTFLQWMGENRSITKEKVIAYKAWLQEHYKTSSANSMLVALNGFLDFMGETQSRVKTVKVQKQMFRSTEKEMSRAEYKKLIEKGMTRSDLSKQSGVPLRTIESWCRRLRVPRDVYQLLKLAKVLGCQIEDLIEPEAGEKKQEE